MGGNCRDGFIPVLDFNMVQTNFDYKSIGVKVGSIKPIPDLNRSLLLILKLATKPGWYPGKSHQYRSGAQDQIEKSGDWPIKIPMAKHRRRKIKAENLNISSNRSAAGYFMQL